MADMNDTFGSFAGLDLLASTVLLLDEELAVRYVNPAGENLLAVSCLLYTSPSPRDRTRSRMPSSA